MTVRELFAICNTNYPYITIYDNNRMLVWEKKANTVLARCPYFDDTVVWINKMDSSEIRIRVDV